MGKEASTSQRIKAIRKALKLTQSKFAERLCVSPASVQGWQYDAYQPSKAMQFKISTVFNVNPQYLSGESDIMFVPPDEDEEIIDRVLADGDPVIKALLLDIAKHPDRWKMLAKSIMTASEALRSTGIDFKEKDN